MSTPDPQSGTPPASSSPLDAQPPKKHRSAWIWVSAVLAVAVIGLLIWGLKTQSDLDNANQDVKDAQAAASQSQKNTGVVATVAGAFKGAYNEVAQQLGATSEDLSATEDQLKQAEQDAAKAQQDAAAAKNEAAQADNATEKANAEAKQAKAEADAAESKAAVVADCTKAYVSSLGKLFEGSDLKAQAAAVRDELKSISGDCKTALAGA